MARTNINIFYYLSKKIYMVNIYGITAKFKEFVNDIINKIPDEELTDNMFENYKVLCENFKKMETVQFGGCCKDGQYTCGLCCGHYNRFTRSKHHNTFRHKKEEAKKYGFWDYVNNTFITPGDFKK